MVGTGDAMAAFKDVDVALLVGARPRGPGMERKDLLEANGKIFAPQGKALDKGAKREVEGLVGGTPRQPKWPDGNEEREEPKAEPIHRDDAARPQPGRVTDRAEDPEAGE